MILIHFTYQRRTQSLLFPIIIKKYKKRDGCSYIQTNIDKSHIYIFFRTKGLKRTMQYLSKPIFQNCNFNHIFSPSNPDGIDGSSTKKECYVRVWIDL